MINYHIVFLWSMLNPECYLEMLNLDIKNCMKCENACLLLTLLLTLKHINS